MFKWICLGFAIVAVLGLSWQLYDIGKDLKQTAKTTQEIGNDLKDTTRILKDMNQFRKLGGLSPRAGNEDLPAYANGLLEFIGKSGGEIGFKNPLGRELVGGLSAENWIEVARPIALGLVVTAKSRANFVDTIAGPYHIKIGDDPPTPLAAWIKAQHPDSKGI